MRESQNIWDDISQTQEGVVMVTGQWLYHLEEVDKKTGSVMHKCLVHFIPQNKQITGRTAGAVMHKCVVHFIPQNKQIPCYKQHPGFIVKKLNETEQRRLFNLTDKDYKDNKQHEVNLLV
ncbi:bromo-adjacent homology domain-containing family protein [Striga asiatica]|uniref:Bromo-adjacent homology domain-containing family protein n=1 Tax=Striga asiatica TaxID=4170 RepID=A0A5A7R076_STRAF|nr:bromo-adjacent homology domain-containing family protein [Striga asiatica]